MTDVPPSPDFPTAAATTREDGSSPPPPPPSVTTSTSTEVTTYTSTFTSTGAGNTIVAAIDNAPPFSPSGSMNDDDDDDNAVVKLTCALDDDDDDDNAVVKLKCALDDDEKAKVKDGGFFKEDEDDYECVDDGDGRPPDHRAADVPSSRDHAATVRPSRTTNDSSSSSETPLPGAYAVPGIDGGGIGVGGGGDFRIVDVAIGGAYIVEPEEDGTDGGDGGSGSGMGDEGTSDAASTSANADGGASTGSGANDVGGVDDATAIQHIVPTATLVRDDESLVYVATITPRWHQQRQTQFMFGLFCLVVISASIGLGIGLSGRVSSSGEIAGDGNSTNSSTVSESSNLICNGTECTLRDWSPCVSSDECDCGCCSGEYSGGELACTPLDETLLLGGYQPTICVGTPRVSWPECSIFDEGYCDSDCCSGHFTGGHTNCTPIAGETLRNICIIPDLTNCTNEYYCIGEWVECASSGDCDSGCCSGSLSGGIPKCVPLDAPGYFPEICMIEGSTVGPMPDITPSPTPACVGTCLGDWSECDTSPDCANGCCSSMYSGGVSKCTPLDPVGYNPELCIGEGGLTPPPTPAACVNPEICLGDWSECESSSDCLNGCCSDEYSGGVLKCTPLDPVGYNPKICNAA